MLRRLRNLAALYGRDLPRPVDVPNLLTFADKRAYRWYGLAMAPLLRVFGGQLRWAGLLEAPLVGAPRAEELLIVRYPHHRRFYAMVMTPYYAVANRLREAAVARFEASFTHPEAAFDELRREPRVALVLHGTTSRAVAEALAPGRLAYASTPSAPILGGRPKRPADPRPLEHVGLALIAFDTVQEARAASERADWDRLAGAGPAAVAALYRRVPLRQLLPWSPPVEGAAVA